MNDVLTTHMHVKRDFSHPGRGTASGHHGTVETAMMYQSPNLQYFIVRATLSEWTVYMQNASVNVFDEYIIRSQCTYCGKISI